MTEVQITILVGLIPVIVAFSFLIFVVYRSRRELEFRNRETELKLQQAEGELKALKAQINPHFIFNSLNSIHHFIQDQNTEEAGIYLVKFSKLIRYVLESSSKKWVSLQEEIDANSTYLELEQVRRKRDFDFSIEWEESDDSELVFIPPMLIQPFLENSIWHGIKENGFVHVKIKKNNFNHLKIIIEDDGQSDGNKSEIDLSNFVKKSSMGLQLMHERFNQLNNFPGISSSFEIVKLEKGETLVQLIIPFETEN
jgi:sensor histidine kinase YesM